MKFINGKIANGLVQVKVNGDDLLISEAVIHCPFCSTKTLAYHESSVDNFLWDISYFEFHLEDVHRGKEESGCIPDMRSLEDSRLLSKLTSKKTPYHPKENPKFKPDSYCSIEPIKCNELPHSGTSKAKKLKEKTAPDTTIPATAQCLDNPSKVHGGSNEFKGETNNKIK